MHKVGGNITGSLRNGSHIRNIFSTSMVKITMEHKISNLGLDKVSNVVYYCNSGKFL